MVKNGYSQSGLYTLKNEQMKLTDFLHAGTNSRILKGDWKFLGLAMVKNRRSQSGGRTLKLTISEK